VEQVLGRLEEVDDLVLAWITPVGDALLDEVRLAPTSNVLDVAARHGRSRGCPPRRAAGGAW
jgi:hypothetical protein